MASSPMIDDLSSAVERVTSNSRIRDLELHSSILVELIPGDECPQTCGDELCHESATVYVTAVDSGHHRKPSCTAHAWVAFADWMVGV